MPHALTSAVTVLYVRAAESPPINSVGPGLSPAAVVDGSIGVSPTPGDIAATGPPPGATTRPPIGAHNKGA